jgi:hypothetical protein
MADEHHRSPHDPNIAYHFDWDFRREAAIWDSERAVGVNFHPLATEFRRWLRQEGKFSIFAVEHRSAPRSLSNPYSYHASVIAAILAQAINASYDFAHGNAAISAMDADIERIRIYNEQVLYTARFCEATIKQLLWCTQVPEIYYKNAALGALLATECKTCRQAGKRRHKISMLGSLAHRYGLCLAFDHCLIEHLKIVNRRRNLEAAHSETLGLQIRTAADSREQLARDSIEVGNELVHMLQHISDLEGTMMAEMTTRIPGVRVLDLG